MPKSLLVYNAKIVTPADVIENGSLIIRDGRIETLGQFVPNLNEFHFDQILDAKGKWCLPGIIDIHTDAIEKEINPRPGANFPIPIAFRELERRMSGCGITTVYHSMYLGYYKAEHSANFSRRELFEQMFTLCNGPTIIDNRIHLRYEIPGVAEFNECLDFIKNGWVHLLSFMDHTPGQGQYGAERYRQKHLELGKTKEEIDAKLLSFANVPRLSKAQMQVIVDRCLAAGIPVASHDDDSAERVKEMYHLGAGICEFPITPDAARQGIEFGMPTVGGASNVLRGGSLSGNLNVKEAILDGVVDTLCSDYYPPAILHAVFKLAMETSLSMPDAVKLSSLNPAIAAGIDQEKGSLEPGKMADFILVEEIEKVPVVTDTFVAGQSVARAKMADFSFVTQ